MAEHRIYRFPEWLETPYKHIILKREHSYHDEERAEPTEQEGRMMESLSRSRRLISEIILCNAFTLFCTFTFSEAKVRDRKDYKAIKARLCKFFNHFRTRYDLSFRYMVIPELHKDGSVHFHGVITTPVGLCSPLKIPRRDVYGNVRMVPNTPRYMDWPPYSSRFGFFSCSWIKNYTGCALYVSKYMNKDLAQWFEKSDQIVLHSKGLKRPELVYIDCGHTIPGDKHKNDYDDEFCAVGMRSAWDTADYYTNPDDYWEQYRDRVETDESIKPVGRHMNAAGEFVADDWELLGAFGFPVDDFEQVTMRALENNGGFAGL